MNQRIGGALRRWQTWLWTAAALLASYLSYLLISGLLTPAPPVVPAENEMVMHGIVGKGQHGKDVSWRFDADTSEISPDGYSTTYHNVHNATYFRNAIPIYKLTANTVTVDSRNQNYSAIGGVHAWSLSKAEPDDLQTEDAYWNQVGQTLTCPAATRFVYKGSVMHTTHMTVNLQTGASQLGDTSIYYTKPSPTPGTSQLPAPAVSAGPITLSPAPISTSLSP